MKKVNKIIFCTFIIFLYFSCVHKRNTEQNQDILSEEIKRNELYVYFDKYAKFDTIGVASFSKHIAAGARNFYFRFKETDSNDTIFEFTFFLAGDIIHESEYKGFLKIDSFNVAIYDEKDLITNLHKDSIYVEKFPTGNEYAGIKNKGDKLIARPVTIGYLKNNKFEGVNAFEYTKKGWHKYFEE